MFEIGEEGRESHSSLPYRSRSDAILRCAIYCNTIQCYTIPYYAMLCYTMLYHIMLCYDTLYGTHPPGVTTDSVRFRSGGSMGDFWGHDAYRRRREKVKEQRRVKNRYR